MVKRKSELFKKKQTAEAVDQQIYSGNKMSDDLRKQLGSELAALEDQEIREGELHVGNFVLSMSGLQFKGDTLTFEDWRDIGVYLQNHKDAIQWMIGDWANLAEPYLDQWVPSNVEENDTPDGKYKWLAEQTGYSYSYLRSLASIAARFPMYFRKYTEGYATFSHCAALTATQLSEDETESWLIKINEKNLSISQLKSELGLLPPSSKQPAIMKRLSAFRQNWRKSWSRLDNDGKKDALEEMRQILREMEEELGDE